MKRTIQNRRILVTGASSGIGRCLGTQLAAVGARLVLVARSADRLQKLAGELTQQYRADVVSVPADLTLAEDRQRLLDTVTQTFGGLDVLVNNAGVASWSHFADSTEQILRRVLEVNFFAPAELLRLAIPLLASGVQPAVVNVASMCGRRGMPAWPEYSASKFALVGLTEALRGELVRHGIDVLLLLPGLTRTGLHDHMLKNEGRARIDFASGMAPERVAGRIVAALQRNRAETVIGGDARWMLLVNKFLPRLVDRLIARRVKKLYAGQSS
jgi:short-subunit dehydrogenase